MRFALLELSVGAFVFAGIMGLIFLAVHVSGVNFSSSEESYSGVARFDDVAGLRTRRVTCFA